MTEAEGILVVDKPYGWTSHDVVKKTRNLLKAKVGHTGTLDPMATGVLVLLVGKATRKAYMFAGDRKRYFAEVSFGYSTDTYDALGKQVEHGDPNQVDLKELGKIIESFTGELYQVPPMFSALKVKGKRLYKLARAGKTIEREPRKIVIFDIADDLSGFPVIKLDITCSAGTYIRSMAHELGIKAGCPAHLSSLRRVGSGKYTIEEAVDFLDVVETGAVDVLKNHLEKAHSQRADLVQ